MTLGDIMSGIPIIPDLNDFRSLLKVNLPHDDAIHGLRTPNEGINKKNSEILGRCGRQKMLRPYLKIWNWDLIFGRAVKTISSKDVCTP